MFGGDFLCFGRERICFGRDSLCFNRDCLCLSRDCLYSSRDHLCFTRDCLCLSKDCLCLVKDCSYSGRDYLCFTWKSAYFGRDCTCLSKNCPYFNGDCLCLVVQAESSRLGKGLVSPSWPDLVPPSSSFTKKLGFVIFICHWQIASKKRVPKPAPCHSGITTSLVAKCCRLLLRTARPVHQRGALVLEKTA